MKKITEKLHWKIQAYHLKVDEALLQEALPAVLPFPDLLVWQEPQPAGVYW